MIEAVRTSETSVNFYVTTLRYIPEDPKLQSTAMFGSFTFHMMSSNFSSCVLSPLPPSASMACRGTALLFTFYVCCTQKDCNIAVLMYVLMTSKKE
jgi:hypothetical protein